jgi:type IV pilus assembly protein PilA
MNNKGVTLIELLIVIVVIGIISAFAVPAVGNFLDSAKQQAVYQDAVAVRNAAAWYCGQAANTCIAEDADGVADNGTALTYANLSDNLDGFDDSLYVTTGAIAELESTNTWQITLESDGTATGDYEWVSTTDPVNGSTADVTVDDD